MKRPRGNAVVLAVLRSPAHRLLSGVTVAFRYTGRRTGRQYVLPVQYARDGSRLVVFPQDPNSKTWWRNFRTRQSGTARVVNQGDPAWEADRLNGPLVEIALDP